MFQLGIQFPPTFRILFLLTNLVYGTSLFISRVYISQVSLYLSFPCISDSHLSQSLFYLGHPFIWDSLSSRTPLYLTFIELQIFVLFHTFVLLQTFVLPQKLVSPPEFVSSHAFLSHTIRLEIQFLRSIQFRSNSLSLQLVGNSIARRLNYVSDPLVNHSRGSSGCGILRGS